MNVKDIVALNEKETRAGFGEGIHELAKENSEVVVLTADLAGSFKLGPFIKELNDYQPLMAKISLVWSFVSGFSIICLTIPASSIKKVVRVVPI